MLATDSGYFSFIFASIEQKDAVIEEGPWHIASQPIILKNWEPGFTLSKEAQTIVPIWCKITGIPLEYLGPKGLSRITSAIKKPLHVDRVTASGTSISFARICIEIEVDLEPSRKFN